MATFLDILPIEIRNQIYEDLLLYRDGSIMLNFDGNAIDRGEGEKVGLHTAILRTCKQAYAEGSNVLYGHNHFRYCTTVFLSYKNRQYRPLTSVFQKIKHVSCICPPSCFITLKVIVLSSSRYAATTYGSFPSIFALSLKPWP